MIAFQDNTASLENRVQDLLGRLTLGEKIGFLPSHQEAIPRLGIEEYHAGAEGAHGVVDRAGGKATVFPQPLGLSCTWDRALLHEVGAVIGEEARAFYDAVDHRSFLSLFCPTIDMERDPRWGRNEEAYGEDPFLAGKLAASLIQGIQGNDPFYVQAIASPKHFYANNFERDRSFTNSVLTVRTKQEYYLRVFSYAFKDGKALSLMTAYNKVNGIPGMLNPELNTVLRDQWGCEGYFVTDGGAYKQVVTEHKYCATHAESLALAVKAGMNVFLDEADLVKNAAQEALEQKLITEADIDCAIYYTLRVRFRLGQFDADASKNPYAAITRAALCSEKNSALARQAAREAVVLLKNDGFLPLKREGAKKIAVIGQLGNENMSDWYSGNPPYEVTPLSGIKKAFAQSEVVYADGCDTCAFQSKKSKAWLRVLPDGSIALDGTEENRAVFRVSDWGYGGFGFLHIESQKYLTTDSDGRLLCTSSAIWGWFVRELFFCEGPAGRSPDCFLPDVALQSSNAIGVAMRQGNSVYNKPYAPGAAEKVNAVLADLSIVRLKDGLEEAVEAAKGADAAVVVVGNHALIGARECIDRETLDLPPRMAALLEGVSRRNRNTVLTVIAGLPYALGPQEGIARAVLYTAHGMQEVGTAVAEALAGDFSPAGRLSQTWYADGRDLPDINDYDIIKNKVTYLYYDKPVLHPFGFGLSYTAFSYSGFSVAQQGENIEASVTLKNTGSLDGDEVPQLYFASKRTDVPRPCRQLCAFQRIHLCAGEEKRFSFTVPLGELAYYDEGANAFALDHQGYTFMIGASSADIRGEQTLERI
ncbi:glucan 1,4-alpha-glucosidase [Spirochaetia bacterium]|nr:glucan 1,4-alpha-glucosidase [Spirochaetia bacterium]